MGEVINISSVSDLDIFSEFDAQCPEIPDEIELAIQYCAENAVNNRPVGARPRSFRTVCAGMVLVSILAVAAVSLISSALEPANSTAERGFSQAGHTDWRQSRESWQLYIKQLESDPAYLRLERERALFQQQYQ